MRLSSVLQITMQAVWQRRTWTDLAPVRARIDHMTTNRPLEEYSWYGPIDKYLSSQVPDEFMLKPQGPLRKMGHTPDPNNRASYGPFELGESAVYPDFILCRFTANPNAQPDTIKAIIEVKKHGLMEAAKRELFVYLDMAAAVNQNVVGFAIAGHKVEQYKFNHQKNKWEPTRWNLLQQAVLDAISNLCV
jgi:hypothetical protein